MDIDRRKLLSAMGSTAGVSAIAAGGAAARDGEGDLTEEELAKALAEMEYVPVNDTHPAAKRRDVDPDPSAIPDDVGVYTGRYKNAETPAGKPYEIQSFEEWRRQDAPTGFDADEIRKQGSEFLYLKEIKKDVEIGGGYSLDKFGVGVGIQIVGSGLNSVEATLSIDVYINRYSVALSSFSVSYGRGRGVCVKPPLPTFVKVIPGLEIDLCLDAKITDEDPKVCLEISPSLSACVNPCGDTISCGYCKGLGAQLPKACVDKPW